MIQKNAKDVDLLRFFRNEEADCEGRMFEDILKYSPDEIEYKHNFIQWIFPTKEKSAYNQNAPIIDNRFAKRFQDDKLAKCNFCKSCQLYLNYIGYQCTKGEITRAQSPYIFYQLPSHNLLRITRVLNSLNQVGNSECSKRLYKALMNELDLHPDKISLTTKLFWEATQPKTTINKNTSNSLVELIS